jgi:hypothetical protein
VIKDFVFLAELSTNRLFLSIFTQSVSEPTVNGAPKLDKPHFTDPAFKLDECSFLAPIARNLTGGQDEPEQPE